MKANELMIDDWVLDKKTNRPYKIIGTNDLLFHNDYSPIPLTTEILEKNGFVKYRNCSTYHILTKDYSLIELRNVEGSMAVWIEWIENNDGIYCDYLLPYPKYVHELQHALRLCNINKKIEIC